MVEIIEHNMSEAELAKIANEMGKKLYDIANPEGMVIPVVLAAAVGACLGSLMAGWTFEMRGDFWRAMEFNTVNTLAKLVVPEGETLQ